MGQLPHIGLILEVEDGLNASRENQQSFTPMLHPSGKSASRRRHRRATLNLCLSRNKIGKPFRFGEVDPSIDEGPACKLPRLRPAHARQNLERLLHRRDHGATAMQVQFGQIFPCRACRPRQPQDKRLVELSTTNIT
jgi:hypothetical protein